MVGTATGSGVGTTLGVGIATGVEDTPGVAVGLAVTVAVTTGVGCCPVLFLEVSFVIGEGALGLLGMALSVKWEDGIDGEGAATRVAVAITGVALGVTVMMSGSAFGTCFLICVPFPTFVVFCTLVEKRKYQ